MSGLVGGVCVCVRERESEREIEHPRMELLFFFYRWVVHVATRDAIILLYVCGRRIDALRVHFFVHNLVCGRHHKNKCINKFRAVESIGLYILYDIIMAQEQSNIIIIIIIIIYAARVWQNIILIRHRLGIMIIIVRDTYMSLGI